MSHLIVINVINESVITITQKQIIEEIPNLGFYICIICRWYMKILMNIGEIVCYRGTQRILILSYLWKKFAVNSFFVDLDDTKCNEINIFLWHAEKHVTNRIFISTESFKSNSNECVAMAGNY